MIFDQEGSDWGFEAAIRLLRTPEANSVVKHHVEDRSAAIQTQETTEYTLGDFNELWNYLNSFRTSHEANYGHALAIHTSPPRLVHKRSGSPLSLTKDVFVELEPLTSDLPLASASAKTQKRAARRARARERVMNFVPQQHVSEEFTTDLESEEELNTLRKSPDRRTLIAEIIGRPRPTILLDTTPPTSPSPPEKRPKPSTTGWPVSQPFLWQVAAAAPTSRLVFGPKDGLSRVPRTKELISKLIAQFSEEKRYLKNAGLPEPAFTALNVSELGVHVFVDLSNIMIGFHDCLKMTRKISLETRIPRVPLDFHAFSLILERGRPAAKRVLVGSDRFPVVQQAKGIGYETNILERVHKLKEVTASGRTKKFRPGTGSGRETGGSGSETNPVGRRLIEKRVEQAVDEILHLKMLESVVDAHRPGTIVLATGDAAEAEYSGGFMRMVERALEKGWVVELVSFRLNTSSAYLRQDFRNRWGKMFRWIVLDDLVEYLVDGED